MAMKFFKEELAPYVSSIKGPAVSISMRRGQVAFNAEAVKMMKLAGNKKLFIEVGYDDEEKMLGFKVEEKNPNKNRAEVIKGKMAANDGQSYSIFIGSILASTGMIPDKGAFKYELAEYEGYYSINLKAGKIKTISKKKKEA